MDNNKLIKEIILSQKDFEKLPRNEKGECVYNGDLYISNYQIKEIPDNLKVDGSLFCSNNRLKKLPNGLKVGDNFYYSNNQIKEIPDNLKVGGNFFCEFNIITKEIKGEIGGEIIMDEEQKKNYDRVVKINKLKERIHE